jgi:hypothetical protein
VRGTIRVMKRIGRQFLNTLTALSVLLWVVSLALWALGPWKIIYDEYPSGPHWPYISKYSDKAFEHGISWLYVTAIATILPALRLRGMRPIGATEDTRRCPRCGYDLRATPDRCPECGEIPAWAAGGPGATAGGQPIVYNDRYSSVPAPRWRRVDDQLDG